MIDEEDARGGGVSRSRRGRIDEGRIKEEEEDRGGGVSRRRRRVEEETDRGGG